MVEARGVEPLSPAMSIQVTTCVSGREDSGFSAGPARYFHPSDHEIEFTPPARSLRRKGQPTVVAPGLSRHPAGDVVVN